MMVWFFFLRVLSMLWLFFKALSKSYSCITFLFLNCPGVTLYTEQLFLDSFDMNCSVFCKIIDALISYTCPRVGQMRYRSSFMRLRLIILVSGSNIAWGYAGYLVWLWKLYMLQVQLMFILSASFLSHNCTCNVPGCFIRKGSSWSHLSWMSALSSFLFLFSLMPVSC